METLTYRLDQFEGPLDLLLSLITKNKVNIEDIPIALICDQYLDYLAKCPEMNMELASDFLVMASELVLIKTRMLLPRTDEDGEDPRAALAAALLEYQRVKGAAPVLRGLYEEYGGRMTKETDELPPENAVLENQDVALLMAAMNHILTNLKPNETVERTAINTIIKKQIVPVGLKIDEVRAVFATRRSASLFELMRGEDSRSEIIATFIAILELIKTGEICMCADAKNGDDNVMLEVAQGAQTTLPLGGEVSYNGGNET